jgi:D-alanyl-D-alanine carboxypeptidase (penicillin-binding protein 5/6)
MYLPLHGSASVIDILRGIIIQSGNDASKAIAEHMAGTEQAFAEIMNAEAKRLGMNNTHFVNSTGMPAPGHVSTARDMAILARAIIQDSPHYYPIYAERTFTYNNIRQGNRNALLYTDPSVDGLKTGHTNAAGFCLVTSAKRGNMRLISAIMGTSSMQARADQTRALLSWGFSNFETITPLTSGQALTQAPLWYGREKFVNAGLAEDFTITMPRGKKDDVEAITRINSDLKAPISKGDVIGEVQIKLNDEIIATQSLVAMSDVDQANFIVRFWHGIKRFFTNLF